MKAYKGFDKDLKCRDCQYEIGKEHIHDGDVEPCKSGLHACTNPIDVLHYYPPYKGSRYFAVDCDGEIKDYDADSKIACSNIKLTTEIGLAGLIKAGVELIFERVKKTKAEQFSSGYRSTAATSAYQSTAATSGDQSTAATSAYQSTAATSGDWSTAEANGVNCVAIANGCESKARGKLGNYIVLTEYNQFGNLLDAKCAKIDGENIKEDIFYMLKNGQFIEA